MNRRQFLNFALVASTGAGVTIAKSASAQQTFSLDGIFNDRLWRDQSTFQRLRIISFAVADLRIAYNGPNGYEAEDPFARGVFEKLTVAFGRSSEEGFAAINNSVDSRISGYEENLRREMNQLISDNESIFVDWLENLGVQTNSELQKDMISAQALFSILLSSIESEGSPNSYADFTWIFPFC